MVKNEYTWKSPSNIALVKYWGKRSNQLQIPSNASISFTLSKSNTTTSVVYEEGTNRTISVKLDGETMPSFVPKIEQFFSRIEGGFPFLSKGKFEIETSNSFPHSSGIASSASGMSALALCICDMAIDRGLLDDYDFFRMASDLARLGSGSASRSVYGPLAIWGQHSGYEGSSDHWAIPYTDVHPVFNTFKDTILLVHRGQKEVSSTVGHNLIYKHPFADLRFEYAQESMYRIKPVLKLGDLEQFIQIVEQEALMLHALMMTSNPYFILMKPNTLSIIERIWQIRRTKGYSWLFTLDAGANVHFMYPAEDEQIAKQFVDNELAQFCQNESYICDHVGTGPQRM